MKDNDNDEISKLIKKAFERGKFLGLKAFKNTINDLHRDHETISIETLKKYIDFAIGDVEPIARDNSEGL